MSCVSPLHQAVTEHVSPGMHLHFSSTPSRSNAAVREVARIFRRTAPGFLISSSGFHSSLHLLARLALGRAYLACFFGDNYPAPRPNTLYRTLARAAPEQLGLISLLSYVEALRAGALGHEYAVNRSLVGTDMGRDLERAGRFRVVKRDREETASHELGLVTAIRPDVTFVHALFGDSAGNVVVSAPTSEGFWAANGAKKGVIVTVEQLLPTHELRRFRDAMPIARHRVLAVCEAPGGAHPQPLHVEPRFGFDGYGDDFDHYLLWRRLATEDALFARFERMVLDAEDGERGYAEFKRAVDAGEFSAAPRATSKNPAENDAAQSVLYVLAARVIRDKVKAKGYRVIIAGIGASFFASRLAKVWLEREGIDVDVIVETGLVGVPCGEDGHEFLLSEHNAARSARLSHVEDALGVLCAAGDRCLGVIGAAQVDTSGAVNSTRSPEGDFLVGAGGASDITATCAEVIVTVRAGRERLVDRVAYVTSRGERISDVVTELGALTRIDSEASWRVASLACHGEHDEEAALARLREACPWSFDTLGAECAAPISDLEKKDLNSIQPNRAGLT